MPDQEFTHPERWDNSLPEAFDDYKDIDFDTEKFDIPHIQSTNMSNDEFLSICILNGLSTLNGGRSREPSIHLEKFKSGYHEVLKRDSAEEILTSLAINDKSSQSEFTRYLIEHLEITNPEDVKEVWREIVALSIIYSLNPRVREEVESDLLFNDSAFEIVRKIF